MATIDNLDIAISMSADNAIRSINRIASAANKLQKTLGGAASGAADVASATNDMGEVTQAAGEYIENTGNRTRSFSDRLKGAVRAIRDFGRRAAGTIGPLKRYNSALGSMLSTFKRIAYYRMVRAAIKAVTQGLREGMTNLYNWSNMSNGVFAASMDRLATSAQYLKNSFGAMASPLVNALAPAIDFLIDKIVVLINFVNQLFAALSGSSMYTAAKKVATSWGTAANKAAGGAKKAASEIKKTILGFDELNVLEKNGGGGGGGGGGSGSPGSSVADMFEERAISSTIKNIADKIRGFVGPIFEWFRSNIETLLPIINAIGASLLLWRLNHKIFPDLSNLRKVLGKIWSVVMTLATVAITVTLSYKFSNDYLQTGNFGNLIASGLTSIAGSAIAGMVIAKNIGKTMGYYTAGITLGITAAVDMFMSIRDINANGIRRENVALSIVGAIKGAIAGSLIAKAVGLKVLAGAAVGGGIALGLPVLVAAYIYLNKALNKTTPVQWGNVQLTADEIQREVQKRFTMDVEATVSLVNTTIENQSQATNSLNEKIAGFNVQLNKLKIGCVVDDSDSEISELVRQVNEGIIPAFQEKQKTDRAVVEVGIALVPPTNADGTPLDAAGLLSNFYGAQSEIDKGLKTLGDQLSEALANGIKDGFTDREMEIITSLSQSIARITQASEIGAAAGEFGAKISMAFDSLDDLNEDTFRSFVDTYISESDRLKKALEESETKAYSTVRATAERLSTTIDALKANGQEVPQSMYDMLASLDEQLSNWNINESVARRLKEEQEPVRREIADTLTNVYFGAVENFKRNYDAHEWWPDALAEELRLENAGAQGASVSESVSGFLDQIMQDALGKDYDWVMDMAGQLDLTGWDIIGKDAQYSFYTSLSETLGSGKAMEVLNSLGYDMSNVLASGIADGTFKVRKEAGGLVVEFKDGTTVTLNNVSKDIEAAFEDSGSGAVDAFGDGLEGMSDAMSSGFEKLPAVARERVKAITDYLTGKTFTMAGATAATNVRDGLTSVEMPLLEATVSLVKTFTTVSDWVNKQKGDTQVTQKVKLVKDWSGTVLKALGLDNLSASIKVGVKADSKNNTIKLVEGAIKGAWTLLTKARGGIIFGNGKTMNIPSYANGTTNAHGTMFIAGEAGPEIVGHIGGRTEVLNRSQLAATMYSAVRGAMSGVTLDANFYAENANGASGEDMETFAEMVRIGVEQAMGRNRDLDRQRNDLLRQISEKETTVEVGTSSINRAQARANRRAGVTIVPIGT